MSEHSRDDNTNTPQIVCNMPADRSQLTIGEPVRQYKVITDDQSLDTTSIPSIGDREQLIKPIRGGSIYPPDKNCWLPVALQNKKKLEQAEQEGQNTPTSTSSTYDVDNTIVENDQHVPVCTKGIYAPRNIEATLDSTQIPVCTKGRDLPVRDGPVCTKGRDLHVRDGPVCTKGRDLPVCDVEPIPKIAVCDMGQVPQVVTVEHPSSSGVVRPHSDCGEWPKPPSPKHATM